MPDTFFGPRWMHQPAEAAFQDGMYEYCHLTRAEHSTEDELRNDPSGRGRD